MLGGHPRVFCGAGSVVGVGVEPVGGHQVRAGDVGRHEEIKSGVGGETLDESKEDYACKEEEKRNKEDVEKQFEEPHHRANMKVGGSP